MTSPLFYMLLIIGISAIIATAVYLISFKINKNETKCDQCGEFENDFYYCPYCGRKFEDTTNEK